MMSAHQSNFQDRIARIKSGQGFTMSTVYVGQEIAFSYVPPNRRRKGAVGQTVSNMGYALSFPFCLAIGFVCHGLERLAEFTLVGLPDTKASVDMTMVKVALAGFLLTVVVTHILGLREKGLLLPKILGVAAGMLLFHNFVHAWPDIFERVFSPIWVAQVTSMTEPNSIVFRGISFSL